VLDLPETTRDELQWRTLLSEPGFEPVSMEDGLIVAQCR
jgi:hypothetical protein